MTSVTSSSLSTSSADGSQVTAAVNVSDATQMENNFIALMVAQIQNQDPTKPVDSTEFLNQYAAMSQVKSLENMASLSQSNLVLLDNLQTLTAAGLVNQEVKVQVDSLTLDGTAVSGRLELASASGSTVLKLTDSNGQITRVELGQQSVGEVTFTLDPQALGLRDGVYQIEAVTDSGEYPSVEVAGVVSKVRVGTDGPVLDVQGIGSVPFYALTEFGQNLASSLL